MPPRARSLLQFRRRHPRLSLQGQSDYTGASCTECQGGQYAAATGASACTTCPAGYYSGDGGSVCTPCAAGHHSGSGYSSCLTCPAGKYEPDTGVNACQNCPAGTYLSATGSTSIDDCAQCDAGKYQSSTGSTFCLTCPAGQSSPAGASACTTVTPVPSFSQAPTPHPVLSPTASPTFQCDPGFFVDGDACTACSPGKFQVRREHGLLRRGPCLSPVPLNWCRVCSRLLTFSNSHTLWLRACRLLAGIQRLRRDFVR